MGFVPGMMGINSSDHAAVDCLQMVARNDCCTVGKASSKDRDVRRCRKTSRVCG